MSRFRGRVRWEYTAVLLLLAAMSRPVTAQDLSGTWQIDVSLDVGDGRLTFELVQEGTQLAGTYRGTFDEAEITGSVAGDAIELQFETQGVAATYVGSFDGDLMRGECRYDDIGAGMWEGRRID